jgi:TonB family protein
VSAPLLPEFERARRPSRALWALAALGALLLHAGGVALAVSHLQPEASDDDLGSRAIEIGLEMSSPRREVAELPPGPDADAAVASAAQAEQVVEQPVERPREVPTETEQPDQVVTPDEVKPQPDKPELAAAEASTASAAAEASAVPSSESAPEAPRAVAPVQGSGASAQRVRATWQRELVAHLDRHKRYPAGRSQKAAEILVAFELDRRGRVLAVRLVKGSGDAAFDDAALAMVRRSDPVPPPPPLIADEGLQFTLPVMFRVKGRG